MSLISVLLLWCTALSGVVSGGDFFFFGLACFSQRVTVKKRTIYHTKTNANNKANAMLKCATVMRVRQLAS